MKKSLKLSLSVCMIVVSLAMLIFGVYAASQVTYSITGSIFYEATGVFATVDTNLYVSTQSVHSAESEINSNSALFETGNTQVSNTQKLFKSDNLSTFGQNNDATVVGQFENLAINYGPYSIANQGTESEEVTSYVYYIVMTVKNYGNQEIAFRLNVTLQQTTANTYIFKSDNSNIDGKSTQEYTEKIFVVAFGIKDVAQDCSSDFTISVTINEDLIVPELYTFSGSTLTGTTEYFTGGDITIPSEYNGTTITSIGANAFSGQTNLTSVVIPSSITSIEEKGFYGCTQLSQINLENVQYIDDQAFMGCWALTTLTLPKVASIGASAFEDCSSLVSVDITESKYNNNSLPNVTQGELELVIGDNAFVHCTALKYFLVQKVSKVERNLFSPDMEIDVVAFFGVTNDIDITTTFILSPVTSYQDVAGIKELVLNSYSFKNMPTSLSDEIKAHLGTLRGLTESSYNLYIEANSIKLYELPEGIVGALKYLDCTNVSGKGIHCYILNF